MPLNKYKFDYLLLAIIVIFTSCNEAKKETRQDSEPITEQEKTWEYLKAVPIPQWYEDAKFGIFIHWGPYAVPGWSNGHYYSEWYSTAMYIDEDFKKYHEENYGKLGEFGYKDFISMFKAEKYNADEWALILKSSGAKYVIPTAEHHDGFAMWDTDLTPWNSVDRGPNLDFIGTLGQAVRKAGMGYGVSYHRERHWGFYTNSLNDYRKDVEPNEYVKQEIIANPEAELLYGPFGLTEAFMEDYKKRFLEICTKYQPDFMWIDDAPSNSKKPEAPAVDKFMNTYHREMIAEYVYMAKDWGKEVYWNNKRWSRNNYPAGAGVDEKDYLRLDSIPPVKWQSSGGMAHSYGYDRTEDDEGKYKSSEKLVETLIDVVSKGGNFLLDIGPKADGTITPLVQSRLKGIGDWLAVNGDAIYGTRTWNTFGYDDIRYTIKGNDLYVLFLNQPEDGFIVKGLMPETGTEITLVNGNKKVIWEQQGDKIILQVKADDLPTENNAEAAAYAFKVKGYIKE
ncbi:alpha-L-fucosidase [Tamlana sp. 2201CG12-4]|uniref:alpha-L-fucosidase n=1 Tax=Tamlana sp. 2201CG12-4 TaxID=3112582 RepID=UPI002DBE6DBD|nr:alpha-L-fucosidase [Tamlana sp. 2201CG12-4]MEC3908486.1 alpha-L-fucosidase [Tamlana sp. 2201CG12-4]